MPRFLLLSHAVFSILCLTARAEEVIDIDVDGKPLHAVVRYIQEISGAPIEMGENRDGLPIESDDTLRVTLKLEAVSWKAALKLAV
ncbi:MAG: hypothetical protein ACYTFG_09110, partial [Planctomycetota bacterium]